MKHPVAVTVSALCVLLTAAARGGAALPELELLLRAPLDGPVVATGAGGAPLAASASEGLAFVAGKIGQAASFGDGQFIEVAPLPPLKLASGTLEFWLWPDFGRHDATNHPLVRLGSADDPGALEIFFDRDQCKLMAVMRRADKKSTVATGNFEPRKWHHIAVTWQTGGPPRGGLRLHVNGLLRATQESCDALHLPRTLRFGATGPGSPPALAQLDEFNLYQRSLTELQVQALFQNTSAGPERVAAVRRLITDEEDSLRAQHDAFAQRRIGMVVGRTIGGLKEKFFRDVGLPFPDKIEETTFETAPLEKYSVLLFPGGGSFQLSEAARQRLRDYINAGGGFVGICAGASAASRYKLIDCKLFPFRETGEVECVLHKHPITTGYPPGRRLDIRHVNGAFIEPSPDVEVVARYNAGPPYAAIVAKKFGQGRVVVISPHPEAGTESRPLVRNALFWAAKVLAPEPVAMPSAK